MNTNALADEISAYLDTKHSRVYRNKSPKRPIFPYVIYRVESAIDTYPSDDLYVNIDVYEDANESVRNMEDLADLIDGDGKVQDTEGNLIEPSGLNHRIINTDTLNLQVERETRQYVGPEELVSTHLINLRYVVRAYFK